ncbi:histone chromosomal protein 6 [Seminavis robusta]|uniref:Histone chromosomal protein 6 n=1 Tax=Seminavis robusta TaxID=568900 RepID=A0A9N8E820_9STRA|nr:histone chromosomal protein 6 [Seminavis robusta]|eukprot:Sro721_g192730.1 histone chromosomal protein 6 (2214) ;mRNA; r:12227-19974
MSSGGMYPESPSFKEALRQARERAAAVNRARSQQTSTAPDPPESGAPRGAKAANNNKAKERRGLISATNARSNQQQPTPPQPDRVSERTAAVAAAPAGTQQQQQQQQAAAAAALYHHLPIQGQLGAMAAHGRPPTLFERLRLRDLQNQMALRQHEQAALYGATISGRPPPGVHWGAHAPGVLTAAAEERWRVAQGLPGAFAAGRGGLHPSVAAHPLGAQILANLQQQAQPAVMPTEGMETEETETNKSDTSPPDNAGKEARAAANHPVAAVGRAAAADATGSSALFDLLATAAEDTLKREEEKKKMATGGEDPDGDDGHKPSGREHSGHGGDKKGVPKMIAVSTTTGGGKNAKRKRKAANEPKNPLGAFVFYQRKIMCEVFEENPCITFGEAAAECGRRWRGLPDEEKVEYKEMAARDKARYTRELATFKNKGDDVVEVPVKATKPPVKKKKTGGDGDAKRAKSAFQFYKAEEMAMVKKEFPNVTNAEASTECSARYKALTKIQKEKYERLAAADRARCKKVIVEPGEQVAKDPDVTVKSSEGIEAAQAPEGPPAGLNAEEDPEKKEKVTKPKPAPRVRAKPTIKYTDMVDPNKFYVEEHAWRYHNPPMAPPKENDKHENIFEAVSPENLRPLPPPPPPPTNFPNTGYCTWSYDYDTRVLHADFRRSDGPPVVTYEDEKYMLNMFERDDVTVVSEGLVCGLDAHKWNLDYLSRVAGDEYYHRFRRFDKEDPEKMPSKPKKKLSPKDPGEGEETEDFEGGAHAEIDRCLSMKVSDFVRYVRQRGTALAVLDAVTSSEEIEEDGLCHFSWSDHNGEEQSVDVSKTVLYMIDYDMAKLLPTLYEDFKACYALGDAVLPGGSHCMMNCVNQNGRPDLGPNIYITPPGSFTHFHQDGHGTVDSGHYCLSGFNEVVMTRRLTERAKRHALNLLTGSYKRKRGPSFEGLYDLPHADLLGEKPKWPDNEAVTKCNEMNYCVSRFILKEGQCVHINKGRLHAFRKMTNERLPYSVPADPSDDCHAFLRANLKMPGTNETVVGPGKPEILCISVAWDWMFRGVTAKGINREVVSSLECAALIRKHGAMSLAIPELSLIQMARTLAPKAEEKSSLPGAYRESLFGFDDHYKKSRAAFTPDPSEICRGIFPGLEYVVKQHNDAIEIAESLKSKSSERHKRVSIAKRPNAWENPVTHPLDPYGNSDFFCKLCNKELSNVYLHCDGCELLLSKDFNICIECHQERRYATSVQMHPLNNKRHSTINHIGNMTLDRASRCPCKNGPVCRHCNYCAGCSCRCHTWFTMHHRFFGKEDELMLLHRVKRVVGKEDLEAAAEAEKRLSMAIRGRFNEATPAPLLGLHLHSMDAMVDPQFQDANELDDPEEERSHDSDMEQDPPAPVRKSRRMSHDEGAPVPMVTSSQEGDEPEMGGVVNDGVQIDVQDMTVTIRCQPGMFSSTGPGIDRIATSSDDEDDSVEETHRIDRNLNQYDSASTETDSAAGGRFKDADDSDDETANETENNGSNGAQRTNTGRWTDEERERLRVALLREPDMDSVVRYVGTRQFPAIRSYAPRTFPKLFDQLRERMEMNKSRSKGRRKSRSPHAVKAEHSSRQTRRSQDPPESGDAKPTTRRSSRHGSRRHSEPSKEEASHNSDDDDDDDDVTDEDSSTEPQSGDEYNRVAQPGTARLKAGKNPILQASQSTPGRSRRATLGLSGGRKRRNGSSGLTRQVDPPVEGDNSETNSSMELASPAPKRARVEKPDEAVAEEAKMGSADLKDGNSKNADTDAAAAMMAMLEDAKDPEAGKASDSESKLKSTYGEPEAGKVEAKDAPTGEDVKDAKADDAMEVEDEVTAKEATNVHETMPDVTRVTETKEDESKKEELPAKEDSDVEKSEDVPKKEEREGTKEGRDKADDEPAKKDRVHSEKEAGDKADEPAKKAKADSAEETGQEEAGDKTQEPEIKTKGGNKVEESVFEDKGDKERKAEEPVKKDGDDKEKETGVKAEEPVKKDEGDKEKGAGVKVEPMKKDEGEKETGVKVEEPMKKQEGEKETGEKAVEPMKKQEGEKETGEKAVEPTKKDEGNKEKETGGKVEEPTKKQEASNKAEEPAKKDTADYNKEAGKDKSKVVEKSLKDAKEESKGEEKKDDTVMAMEGDKPKVATDETPMDEKNVEEKAGGAKDVAAKETTSQETKVDTKAEEKKEEATKDVEAEKPKTEGVKAEEGKKADAV